MDYRKKLLELKELNDLGVLSDEEYEISKAKLTSLMVEDSPRTEEIETNNDVLKQVDLDLNNTDDVKGEKKVLFEFQEEREITEPKKAPAARDIHRVIKAKLLAKKAALKLQNKEIYDDIYYAKRMLERSYKTGTLVPKEYYGFAGGYFHRDFESVEDICKAAELQIIVNNFGKVARTQVRENYTLYNIENDGVYLDLKIENKSGQDISSVRYNVYLEFKGKKVGEKVLFASFRGGKDVYTETVGPFNIDDKRVKPEDIKSIYVIPYAIKVPGHFGPAEYLMTNKEQKFMEKNRKWTTLMTTNKFI